MQSSGLSLSSLDAQVLNANGKDFLACSFYHHPFSNFGLIEIVKTGLSRAYGALVAKSFAS